MKISFLLTLLYISILGCKKYAIDYRDIFNGNYNYSIHKTAWILSGPTLDTTYSYYGEIQNGSENNTILINYSDNVSIETTIYEDETLDNCICSHYGNLRGKFESTNKIKINFTNVGLGSGSAYNANGEKK